MILPRPEFFRRYWWRFTIGFLLIGLLFYTFYHVFGASASNLLTTPARDLTDYSHYFGTGYLFRDEEVLTVSGEGLVDPQVSDATKVSRGVTVAKVYPVGGDLAAKQSRLALINRQIALLEESALPVGSSISRAAEYRRTAEQIYLRLRRQVSAGFYLGLETASEDFFVECNKVAELLESGQAAKDLLDAYRAEKAALLSGSAFSVAPEGSSGYYYDPSRVDGYESVFTMDRLESLSVGDLERLAEALPTAYSGTVAGKIVYGYLWYLAIPVEASAAEHLEEGDSLVARFSFNGDAELKVTCQKILPGNDGKIVLVVSCGENPDSFFFFRSQPVELLIENCSGYYVPDSALRTQKGETGVYVFETGTVYFRKIKILYEGNGYVIAARREDTERGYLAKNDLMVTSGKNLYDGKVYR
ncbi:MAG: hypothetical protein IJR88_01100 [Clostridia bacterium]|nr:hypothetical protein [Clostridia bacterium]